MSKIYIARGYESVVQILAEDEQDILAIIDDAPSTPLDPRIVLLKDLKNELMELYTGARSIDHDIIDWLKEWPDKPVLGKKSMKQLTEFRSTSLWWFAETMLFREHIAHNTSLREIVRRTETISYALKKHRPDIVVILDNDTLTSRCAQAVCSSTNVKYEIARGPDIYREPVNLLNPFLIKTAKGLRLFIRTILVKINRDRFRKRKADPPILLSSYYSCLRKGADGEVQDIIFSRIINSQKTPGGGAMRIMYADRRLPLGLSSVRELEAPAFHMEAYNDLCGKRQRMLEKRLLRTWKKLASSRKFRKSLTYNGIDLWPLLKDHLAYLFVKQFPEAGKHVDIMRQMIRTEKPRVVLIHNETGFYGRAIIAASKNTGTKTIGIQHGTISSINLEYIHRNKPGRLSCPVPDIMAVWGDKVRDILLDSMLFEDSNVVVTGNPRYDILSEAPGLYDKKDFKKRHGITADRIVAVTTQPFPIYTEREDWLKALVSNIRDLDAVFIIKPHPSESPEMHEEICSAHGGGNCIVLPGIDTLELLYISDLTITSYSTTGHESLLLGTPLLTLNLTGKKDTVGYADSGAAISVNDGEKLGQVLAEFMGDNISPSLQENMKRYVEDYAFRIDGMSSERILNLALSIMNRSDA